MTRQMTRLVLVAILLLHLSCEGKQIKPTKERTAMQEQVSNTIKNFKNKPFYSIYLENGHSGCQFEVLLNDIPIFKFLNQRGGVTTSPPLNAAILKSGTQKLKIKLYPSVVRDRLIVSYKENTPLSLTLMVGEATEDDMIINDKTIYELPFIPLPEEGLPYWETEIEFEAEVPYDLVGWSQSKDLTKVENIEAKVLKKFKELQKVLDEKDNNKLVNLYLKKDQELNTCLYVSEKGIKASDEFLLIEDEEEVVSFDGAIVKFYAEGRLVSLENPKDGKSALRTIIKDKSGKEKDQTIIYSNYLHMPEGSDEFEIIR